MPSCSRATCGLLSVAIFDHARLACLMSGRIGMFFLQFSQQSSPVQRAVDRRNAAVLERQGSGYPGTPATGIASAQGLRVSIENYILSNVGGLRALHSPLHLAPEYRHVTASQALRVALATGSLKPWTSPKHFVRCSRTTVNKSCFEIDAI